MRLLFPLPLSPFPHVVANYISLLAPPQILSYLPVLVKVGFFVHTNLPTTGRVWNSYTKYVLIYLVSSGLWIVTLQTETDDVPLAVMAFQGRLVAGVGKALRIYDIGKKKLLRKVENKVSLTILYFYAEA